MDPEQITILVAVITGVTSSGLTSLVQFFVNRRDKKCEKTDEMHVKLDKVVELQKDLGNDLKVVIDKLSKTNEVTMSVARDRIYYLCKKSIKEKDVDPDTIRDIKALVDPYISNGGPVS